MALVVPSSVHASSIVRSVEYVEIGLIPGMTSGSVALTKGQNIANCVPFASLMTAGTGNNFDRILTDVYFQAGPLVTVERSDATTGSVDLGIYVVEFDPTAVAVQQGTFSLTGTSTTTGITTADSPSTALVFYYRTSAASSRWDGAAVAGRFQGASQLFFERNVVDGTMDGHYYVVEGLDGQLSVQSLGFTMPGPSFDALISPVPLDRSFVIASYRTAYDEDNAREAALVAFLSSPNTFRVERQVASSATFVEAFVVTVNAPIDVQRGSLPYAAAQAQQLAGITAVDLGRAMAWNGVAMLGPGSVRTTAFASADMENAFQRLKLANATTVQGDRGQFDFSAVGRYEVVDWGVPCCVLDTVEAAGSIGVTAPGQFETVFTTNAGGSMEEFYDLVEDPGRTLDLVGALASSTNARGLHNVGMNVAGGFYNAGSNTDGPKLDPLEVTPTRVKLRQESFYQDFPGGPILAGPKVVGDYSLYGSGKVGLRWRRRVTSPVTYMTEYTETLIRFLSSAPLNGWSAFFQSGTPPGPGTEDFSLIQNETAGAPGARTDFLHILYEDWTIPNGYLGDADQTDATPLLPPERINAFWTETTGATINPDPGPYSQAPGEVWDSLTYFKPTDFTNHLDPAVTARSADYRNPDPAPIAVGAPWADLDENTTAADRFNEAEAAYLFDMDPVNGLVFDLDGSSITRHVPFFKMRQWRALRAPRQILLESVPLLQDVHFTAAVKPVSRAHFVDELGWHCTFEGVSSCDPGVLDVGSTGSAAAVGAILPGRYGSAAEFSANTHFAMAGTAGSGDFSPTGGAVELWYQPYYGHLDGARYLIWFNQSGAAGDFHCMWLEKNTLNELRFTVSVNYADAACTTPDGNSATQFLAAPPGLYGWLPGTWVHLEAAWNLGGTKQMRLLFDGRELAFFSGAMQFPPTAGPTVFGGCSGAACPAGPGNANGRIDEPHIYSSLGPTGESAREISHAGLRTDFREFLDDPGRNLTLGFAPVDAVSRGAYMYMGADSKFRGLNVVLSNPGTGTVDLVWEYWDGAMWADLEAVAGFTDTTSSFTQNGTVFWTGDPPFWAPYSVDGGPDLFHVRVHLAGAPYLAQPVERQIKTDILLFQYCGDITASAQTFDFAPVTTSDLSITKTDGSPSSIPGTAIAYTITVTNNGPGPVTSLFVDDPIPAGITGASFTPLAGSYNDATGEWTGLSLTTGQSAQLILSGTVDPFARGSLVNSATVSPPGGVVDPDGSNDFASDTNTLLPSTDVEIVKDDDIDPAPVSGLVTYTLTVTNNGPSGATNVDVTDPLPSGMELDNGLASVNPSQGSCLYDAPTRTVDCSLGNLAPFTAATVTIEVRSGSVGSYDNTASVTRTEPDPVSANDSDNETTTVEVSTVGVQFLTATSTFERNVLEWVNPIGVEYLATQIVYRTDRYPADPSDGTTIYNSGVEGPGGRGKVPHATGAGSNSLTFYYAAFVHRSVLPLVSPGRFCTGRPFDHTSGPVKWAFSTGATAIAAPTVGGSGIVATSNDNVVYAMERGIDDDQVGVDSGEWPAAFEPIELGGPVQLRSPVIPITVFAANPVAYLGSQDGSIYVVDATQGGAAGGFPWGPTPIGPMVQAAPAGIFMAFSGTLDYLLVGTRDGGGPNAFHALDPFTGAPVDSFDNGGAGPGAIGIVNGMATVDYGTSPPRVYFTSYQGNSSNTVWCFELDSSVPVFTPCWTRQLGNIDSSPVLSGGRIYVGSPLGGGTVYSLRATDGLDDRTFPHGNGQVKGFVFPDRASNDLYFATDDFVWGITDTGAPLMTDKLGGPVVLPAGAKPSPVLFVPGSHFVYVGGSNGSLYEIDVSGAPILKPQPLGDGFAAVGAPSLDLGFDLVHVGTEAGIFYAVQVPLP